jgi:nucleotide-binding universal stress UspA family protein
MKNNNESPIVCGTDFSATATEAVDIAAAMARRLASRLVLVHADQFYRSLVADPTVIEAALSERRGDLNSEAKRLRDLGTQVEEKFLSGSAPFELATAATKSKVDSLWSGRSGTVSPDDYFSEA